MKNILLFLLLTISNIVNSQLPYSWTTGSNPGWTSSNQSVNTLSWQSVYGAVSTSDFNGLSWNTYNNSQNTTYTSPNPTLFNFTSCAISNFIQVTLILDINLQSNADYLYFQYSIDGGVTWLSPPSNNWTGSLGYITPTYTLPKTTNRFRFIFISDIGAPIRWYRNNGTYQNFQGGAFQTPVDISNGYFVAGNPGASYIYYADILDFTVSCIAVLPVELSYFEGDKYNQDNVLTWKTESENNNDYFALEWTSDPMSDTWSNIANINGAGSDTQENDYNFVHDSYTRDAINYYRLTQVDYNGTKKVYQDLVAIDNRIKDKNVVKIINLLGQEVNENTSGILIYVYEDGTTSKTYNR